MLKRQGWSEGEGLGATSSGRKMPLMVERQEGRLGLGAQSTAKMLRNSARATASRDAPQLKRERPKAKRKVGWLKECFDFLWRKVSCCWLPLPFVF
jgi:G-patch domain